MAKAFTANCICEISCLSTSWVGSLNTVHELSNIEKKKISAEPGFEPGAAGWEAWMLPLCYAAPLELFFFAPMTVADLRHLYQTTLENSTIRLLCLATSYPREGEINSLEFCQITTALSTAGIKPRPPAHCAQQASALPNAPLSLGPQALVL